MAKSFKRGDDYKFYINTGSVGSPTWVLITAVSGIAVDPAPSDIVVPESGFSDGHMQGYGDPAITATLYEDTGDTNIATLLTAMHAGTLQEIAVANGPIATAGTKFYRLEACCTGLPLSADRGEASSYDCEFKRHANATTDLTRNTAS